MTTNQELHQPMRDLYASQRVEGIHKDAPRTGLYKILGLYTKDINGTLVTMVRAHWKHKPKHAFIPWYVFDFILDSLKQSPSPDHSYFFNSEMIGQIIHITDAYMLQIDGLTTYQLEWKVKGEKKVSLNQLNERLKNASQAGNSALMTALDESAEIHFDDYEDDANF
ncbi:MAG: hypothetical protein EOO90_05285 [Pedobacter sp.]|nr:MAG: hypothetical protein EOO90_05285 [Pedobacter sp.]